MPHVTVIIPNYNHENYLRKRIDSVLAQSYEDFEVIILDDCSIDGSRAVIESYRGHPKISHIVYNEHNSGSTFKQWDIGFALSKGEYIWIAESDDVAERDFLRTCVALFDNDGGLSLVSVNANIIDAHGNLVEKGFPYACYNGDNRAYEIYEGRNLIEKFMLKDNVISNASGVLFRKDLALKIPQSYKNYKLNGDWLFWLYLIYGNKVALVKTVLNNFRRHAATVRLTTRHEQSVVEQYLLFEEFLSHINASDELQNRAYKYKFKSNLSVFNHYKSIELLYQKGLLSQDKKLSKRLFWEKNFGIYSPVIGKIYDFLIWMYHNLRIVFFICKAIWSKLFKKNVL